MVSNFWVAPADNLYGRATIAGRWGGTVSDSGKLERPEKAIPPKASEVDDPAHMPAVPARWSEIRYRATGGQEGSPPLHRIMSNRAAAGASVIQRQAIMRKVGAAADVGGQPKVPQGTGAPLGSEVRARMEPKLGADLSAERVHTGGESAQAAKGFGTGALKVGDNGHLNPWSTPTGPRGS